MSSTKKIPRRLESRVEKACFCLKRFMTHGGKHERKNRERHSSSSLSREGLNGTENTESHSEARNSPREFKRLQMCAWAATAIHLRPEIFPHNTPAARPPFNITSYVWFKTHTPCAPKHWKSHLTELGVNMVDRGQPGNASAASADPRVQRMTRGLQRPLSRRLVGEIWPRESLGDFRRESNRATEGQQKCATSDCRSIISHLYILTMKS